MKIYIDEYNPRLLITSEIWRQKFQARDLSGFFFQKMIDLGLVKAYRSIYNIITDDIIEYLYRYQYKGSRADFKLTQNVPQTHITHFFAIPSIVNIMTTADADEAISKKALQVPGGGN